MWHAWGRDNIGIEFREIVWECVEWFRVAQVRDQWRIHVNTVMNFRVLQGVGKFLTN
jgi:hypothetical protein